MQKPINELILFSTLLLENPTAEIQKILEGKDLTDLSIANVSDKLRMFSAQELVDLTTYYLRREGFTDFALIVHEDTKSPIGVHLTHNLQPHRHAFIIYPHTTWDITIDSRFTVVDIESSHATRFPNLRPITKPHHEHVSYIHSIQNHESSPQVLVLELH